MRFFTAMKAMFTNVIIWPLLGLLALLWMSTDGFGYDDNANDAGKALAIEVNTGKVMQAGETTDPASMPGYAGNNPPETQYYHSGLDIENQARTQAQGDANAQYILNARDSRPLFAIDRQQDPLFKRYDDVTLRAHDLSNTYEGCVELPVGNDDVTRHTEKTCTVAGRRDQITYTCRRTLNVSCENANANQSHPYTLAEFTVAGDPIQFAFADDVLYLGDRGSYWRRGRCSDFHNSVRFNVEDVGDITQLTLREISYDDRADVHVNGTLVFSGAGRTMRTDGVMVAGGRCEQRVRYQTYANDIDLLPLLRNGSNEILIDNQVGDGGGVYLELQIRRKHPCHEQDRINYTCPQGESQRQGSLQRRVCTQGAGTINGFYRTCWRWDDTYRRVSEPIYTRDPSCDALVQQDCGQISAECTQQAPDYCVSQTLTYSCPEVASARNISLCGNELVCANGNCTEDVGRDYAPATEGFTEAAASLAVAQEIAQNLDVDTLTVFNGTKKECERKMVGASNCCADGGWATDVNLASCTTDERILGLEKEAGQAVYVGSYSSGGLLDQRDYQVYCTYPSKIARIFMQQGKPQLNLGFGTTSAPDCSGFTLQQIERLNFDAMDFSELYDDMLKKAENGSTPDGDVATEDVSRVLQTRYPQVQAP